MTTLKKTWIASDRFIPRRFVRPALRLTQRSAASGIVLIAATVIAMLWANLPVFGDSYAGFWHGFHLDLSLGPVHVYEDLNHLVNDGLMAIFFLVVGLEIKRELVLGELRDPRKAALPVVAALGGMALPALIYVAFNAGNPEALRGWGVPMATDIAFSLGILALLGSRAPVGVRLFLLAVAIADDIGAIVVIALFYTSDLDFRYLALGIGTLVLIAVGAKIHIRSYTFYVPLSLIAWFGFLESGVHATIAGVILGLMTPSRPLYDAKEFDSAARRIVDLFPTDDPEPRFREKVEYEARLLAEVARESIAPLSRVQHVLHDWSAFVIIPIFALANAGVVFARVDFFDAITSRVALGVAFGLVVGKMVGVTGSAWLVVKLGWARLPDAVTWRHMIGTGILTGVGFTVALFIAELAYQDHLHIDLAKMGVFLGSIVAATLGYLVLHSIPMNARTVSAEVNTENLT